VLVVGLAFIPAKIASDKGYSFGGFYAFGFFFFLPALIVAAVLEDKKAAAEREDSLRNDLYRLRQDINTRALGSAGADSRKEYYDPKCRQCGHLNETGTKFCIKCGAMLAQAPNPEEFLCPKCRAMVTPGSEFCGSCGWKLAEKEPEAVFVTAIDGEIRCPLCGAIQKSDRASCFRCGAKFECRA
jgi:predicted RNA-binding Zn-ribbon protein involved in translation (DUF1610 family)